MTSKMWVPFIALGFMVVLAAFVYGLVNAFNYVGLFASLKRGAESGGARVQDVLGVTSGRISFPALGALSFDTCYRYVYNTVNPGQSLNWNLLSRPVAHPSLSCVDGSLPENSGRGGRI